MFSRLLAYRSALAGAIVALSIGISVGWYTKAKLVQADLFAQEQEANARLLQAVKDVKAEYEARALRDAQTIEGYMRDLRKLSKVKSEIEELRRVETKPECDIPVDVIRLLNSARSGSSDSRPGMSGASDHSAGEGKAPAAP